jgi:CheY-specific phosphatase CheX
MKPQLRTTMKDAISNVLETMFFFVPAFEMKASLQSLDHWPFVLESSITITGEAQRLKLLFRATRGFASMITANFLGVAQEEVLDEEMEDTLKELANMVGGDYLARMPSENWELGIPKIEQPRASIRDYLAPNMDTLVLSDNEEPMATIHLYLDQ